MIHFLVTSDHPYTLTSFFEHWGSSLRQQVRIVHYESRSWEQAAPPGTWVFTDLERLTAAERSDAQGLFQRLSSDPSRWQAINDPGKALRRHDLLKTLADRGINTFRAYPADALPDTLRYPVFVRVEDNHNGALSPLLPDRDSLQRTLDQLRRAGTHANFLVVEYCPYDREDGLFVKRSVMRVGGALIPRHLLFSRKWEVKVPDQLDEACMAEEEAFISGVPKNELEEVRNVFNLACIDYGRIDYALVGGRVQVFEINTNPMLVLPVSKIAPSRWPGQARSAILMLRAMEALNADFPQPTAAETRSMSIAARKPSFLHRLRRRFSGRRQ